MESRLPQIKSTKEIKADQDELKKRLIEEGILLDRQIRTIKSMPQGPARWTEEDRIVAQYHVDPAVVRIRPSWSNQDWQKHAIELKDEARRFRTADMLDRALACEKEAKVAEARAAWLK